MIKITLLVVGKYKNSSYIKLEDEYLTRMKSQVKFEILELKESMVSPTKTLAKAVLETDNNLLLAVPKNSVIILLDSRGTERSSVEFASFLDRLTSLGRNLCFIIGPSFGVGEDLLGNANHIMSLSKLTFPHNLARLLLIEQIYRGLSIINQTSYHK